MLLSDEVIQSNKEKFIEIVNSITREFNKEYLLETLEGSDFFYAPASTKYHGAYKGGLCDHCLNVYFNLKSLVEKKHLGDVISDDSIAIVALFHDLSKMSFYEPDVKNKKVYSPTGSKYDQGGNYDWVSVTGYKVREASDRIIYGSHEETSEFIARNFIPLTQQESVAILHHMGGKGWDSAQDDITVVFNNNPLATLLHVADVISTYVDEAI